MESACTDVISALSSLLLFNFKNQIKVLLIITSLTYPSHSVCRSSLGGMLLILHGLQWWVIPNPGIRSDSFLVGEDKLLIKILFMEWHVIIDIM